MPTFSLTSLLQTAIIKSFSYESHKDYIPERMRNYSAERKAYTELNLQRMRRWEKTLTIAENDVQKIEDFNQKVTWLVISEGWCGDAAHTLPVMQKFAKINKNISLRIIFRDEHKNLMNHFLTNGTQSIPKLVICQPQSYQVVQTWGPRPKQAEKLLEAYREKCGKLDAEFRKQLQQWYNKDKGKSTLKELLTL